MRITYKKYTDIGDRRNNEDSIGVLEWDGGYCFALADGLGGHGMGEVASATAVETALRLFKTQGQSPEYLEKAFRGAQDEVLQAQNTGHAFSDMKTTMVLLKLTGDRAGWGHIGDSRLYHFQNGKLKGHTLDHSVPQMLVNVGEIREKDIRFHEDRNRLLRVIGAEWGNRSFEISEEIAIRPQQAFLLCSDGFWERIDEKQMMKELKNASSVDEWMDSMTGIVRNRNERKNKRKKTDLDNNSAIAVWITKD